MGTYFTTSTIKDWQKILTTQSYCDIIIHSLKFLIDQKRIDLHAYVIMPNHIHLLFTPKDPFDLSSVFRDFHKYTGQQIIKEMRNNDKSLLEKFISSRTDRKYQIWQTTHAPKEIYSEKFLIQKIDYIHENPCREKWALANTPQEYPYSSALDYMTDKKGFLPINMISI